MSYVPIFCCVHITPSDFRFVYRDSVRKCRIVFCRYQITFDALEKCTFTTEKAPLDIFSSKPQSSRPKHPVIIHNISNMYRYTRNPNPIVQPCSPLRSQPIKETPITLAISRTCQMSPPKPKQALAVKEV
jgi:hypothetical protein